MDRYRFFQFFFTTAVVWIAYLVIRMEMKKDKVANDRRRVVVQSEDLASILRNAVHAESKRNEH